MLSAHTATYTSNIFEDEGVNRLSQSILQVPIVVARDTHIQMNIPVPDVPIPGHIHQLLFLF